MKPMLAATIEKLSDIQYPVFASHKLDGVRVLNIEGDLRSRSLKPIPNKHVNDMFSSGEFSGLDGELIVGSPKAKDVYRKTVSVVMSENKVDTVNMYLFDSITAPYGFKRRVERLQMYRDFPGIVVVDQKEIRNESDLLAFEHEALEEGYEGLILRAPGGRYKHGRSTMREQGMMKLKRFVDSEAEVLAVVEELENQNEKKTNELGRGARSSHKENKVPKGRAGGLEVRDLKSGVEFTLGTGMNDVDKAHYWKLGAKAKGLVVKYKYFPVGVKDKPRHPVYLGPRDKRDM